MTSQHFYLFETFMKNVYKFGRTKNEVKKRFRSYSGISKPKKLVGIYDCPDADIVEAKFKLFLCKYQIEIVTDFGNEYFEFEGGIEILFDHFCKLLNENFDFTINAPVLKRKMRMYQTESLSDKQLTDVLVKWFFETYQETNENKYIPLRDLRNDFKYSDTYRRLSSKQRHSLTKRNFETHILSNLKIRKYHKFLHGWKDLVVIIQVILVLIQMN